MDLIKAFINLFADPRLFFVMSVVALAVIVWKREAFSKDVPSGTACSVF